MFKTNVYILIFNKLPVIPIIIPLFSYPNKMHALTVYKSLKNNTADICFLYQYPNPILNKKNIIKSEMACQ